MVNIKTFPSVFRRKKTFPSYELIGQGLIETYPTLRFFDLNAMFIAF
jgi:hypothetical protein